MVKIESPSDYSSEVVPAELLKGKRHLTAAEIEVLEKNLNHNEDPTWNNFYVNTDGSSGDCSTRYGNSSKHRVKRLFVR